MLSLIKSRWFFYGVVGVVMAASNGWTAWKVQTITTRHYERKIAVLETEKRNLLGAINDIQRLEKEIDEELEKSRKAGDSVKPVTVYKPADRMRKIGAYPGCRDCE